MVVSEESRYVRVELPIPVSATGHDSKRRIMSPLTACKGPDDRCNPLQAGNWEHAGDTSSGTRRQTDCRPAAFGQIHLQIFKSDRSMQVSISHPTHIHDGHGSSRRRKLQVPRPLRQHRHWHTENPRGQVKDSLTSHCSQGGAADEV